MKQKKRNSFAVLGYTKNMMAPMVAFTAAVNAIFAARIIAAFALTGQGVTDEFVLSHDKIVVLKEGRVAETGIPAELKKAGGIYRHMADMQLSSEQWKYQ